MKNIFLKIATIIIVVIVSSCTKMEKMHEGFIQEGPVTYIGKIDSVKVQSGMNRVLLKGKRPSDPDAKIVKIRWEFEGVLDSIEKRIDDDEASSFTSILIEDLLEGNYTFYITTYDEEGNSSVPIEKSGFVYGQNYIRTLRGPIIEDAKYISNQLSINWGQASDPAVQGLEVSYENLEGDTEIIKIGKNEEVTVLNDFMPEGEISYRTVFLPDTNSIDTVFSVVSKIPYTMELNKTNWFATASSFDSRGGASYRPPSNVLDNNPRTIWVNFVGPPASSATDYPHTIMVDMGDIKRDIVGFTFIMRTPLDGALKTAELLVSLDNVTWRSFGDFTLDNVGTQQFVQLPENVDCQYIKVIAKNDYKNSKNIALAELGLYKVFNKE